MNLQTLKMLLLTFVDYFLAPYWFWLIVFLEKTKQIFFQEKLFNLKTEIVHRRILNLCIRMFSSQLMLKRKH